MVGSKDTKRKRKESPPVPTQPSPAQQASSSVNIESSPEIPKRTKVQAQRKFAQGQSAPSSSTFSSANVTPSCSNGPTVTATASREPPIEILPNKRPKTEDFLTFLCFRGTSDLPPHLDFFNQGDGGGASGAGAGSVSSSTRGRPKKVTTPGRVTKAPKSVKPVKRGRNSKVAAAKVADQTKITAKTADNQSSSKVETVASERSSFKATEERGEQEVVEDTKNPVQYPQDGDAAIPAIIPFAVRKRAEQVPEGNRSNVSTNTRAGRAAERQLRNNKTTDTTATTTATETTTDKCNNLAETHVKRRSNRTSAKDVKPLADGCGVGDDDDEDEDDDDEDEDDDDDEYYSARDELLKTDDPTEDELKDTEKKLSTKKMTKETDATRDEQKEAKKEVRAAAGRKGDAGATASASPTLAQIKAKDAVKRASGKMESQAPKEKPPPIKRPRQKESPIFIPSPEPSGRMTRQRAFFEPVKVPHRDDEQSEREINEPKAEKTISATDEKQKKSSATDLKITTASVVGAAATTLSTKEKTAESDEKGKSDLKVFDFSSDDEQPLAKSIKLKTTATTTSTPEKQSPGKRNATAGANRGGRKGQTRKGKLAKKEENMPLAKIAKEVKNEKAFIKVHITGDGIDEEEIPLDQIEKKIMPSTTVKRGNKVTKANATSQSHVPATVENPPKTEPDATNSPAGEKKTTTARQARKRTKAGDNTPTVNGDRDKDKDKDKEKEKADSATGAGEVDSENANLQAADAPQMRNQRPTRKTKEAATIYMGIIGHKLQLGDDEDDDLSLNSFPDLPNVKEVEKIEIELKKNATQTVKGASKSTAGEELPSSSKSPNRSAKSPVNTVGKPQTAVRRGRPPKQNKGAILAGSGSGAVAGVPSTSSNKSDTLPKKAISTKLQQQQRVENANSVGSAPSQKGKDGISEKSKLDSDDEDFLLSKEVNVTKRNLAKSFSDSDDEPLAIKVNVRSTQCEKELDKGIASLPRQATVQSSLTAVDSTKITTPPGATSTVPELVAAVAVSSQLSQPTTSALGISPANSKAQAVPTQQQLSGNAPPQNIIGSNVSPTSVMLQQMQTAASPFKPSEKKSPVPTSKILNVPATYGTPPPSVAAMNAANFNKAYMQAGVPPPAPYHQPMCNIRPGVHPQMVPLKTPTAVVPQPMVGHPIVPIPPQMPIKYQTSPTTYPPPIEAYPSPKINPNFLTPKFDRMSMPRPNNFPSPSPVRFDGPPPVAAPSPKAPMPGNSSATVTATPKTATSTTPTPAPPAGAVVASTSTGAAVAVAGVNAAAGGGGGGGAGTSGVASTAAAAGAVVSGNGGGGVNASATVSAAAAPSTTAAAAAAAGGGGGGGNTPVDPLKEEIDSILQANLMPSKEESGKIFGIASVSLAQSSGPDNTKCTLGKCGSIHKPVLGPVVPTEGYIGDQMSSKERRKAKVNMTHEQIQKWLIECSSNPDEIQDDLDDDFDDNLRPNMYAISPPPTRDDKECTSFSSSSKATREMGRSEVAWSAKGVSLKATQQQLGLGTTRREEKLITSETQLEILNIFEEKTTSSSQQMVSTTVKTPTKPNTSTFIETFDKKVDDKSGKSNTAAVATGASTSTAIAGTAVAATTGVTTVAAATTSAAAAAAAAATTSATVTTEEKETTTKQKKSDFDQDKGSPVPSRTGKATASTPTDTNPSRSSPSVGKSVGRKKNITSTVTSTTPASSPNQQKANATATTSVSPATSGANNSGKTTKRTPVYNQKAQKQFELKETTTTSHRKSAPFSYGAFSADNEKSVYSFDKDEDDVDEENASKSKPKSRPGSFRRQGRRDSQPTEEAASSTTPTSRTSPGKRRAAAAAAEKANRDLANANNSSVSLTLSPAENSKLVKVSLEAEKAQASTSQGKTTPTTGKNTKGNAKKNADPTPKDAKEAKDAKDAQNTASTSATGGDKKDGDSDSDGHTFYIPLQGSGLGKDSSGSIQGVAVKLGREGPDGPNQKVIMHATLVTKAQIGAEEDSAQHTTDKSKTQESSPATKESPNSRKNAKSNPNVASTSAAAAAAAAAAAGIATTSNSAKSSTSTGAANLRSKGGQSAGTAAETTATAGGSGGLARVNSNSSLLSGSGKSRTGTTSAAAAPSAHNPANKKFKDDTPIKMANNTAFPRHDDPTQMVEAPIFRPTEKEFADPIEFIERITPIAARFGICKIIPPSVFKPECRISDDMRFTAYNQYVHKMLHRWGPSAKELSAIKKYLATQSIVMNHPPWIGGMEVDLPRLYHTVQELGGLKEVIEKKKWSRVAEEMCIPKLAQDRVTKLDDIYCKYLLPYDTLSPAERQKLFDEVEADWAKREARARRNADRFVNTESVSNEDDDDSSEDEEESEEEVDGVSMECIVKGRSMALNQFYRIARNTMALWFKNTEPIVNEVEAEFWRHVAVRDSHVCVHSGSIDSSGWGYGFPSPGPKGKGSNYARHPWNLKVLTNNPGSVLRSLGPVMGVTVPTLHVGMLFSACCWYRDPHGLSWIEYLHTGASKLWYGIPDDQSANFRAALTSLIPTHCQNKTIWLPCDTVMVPPHMLTDRGVSLCRIEQKPGEFIVVFPRAYTSSLATGYVVSESVYFATTSWLDLAKDDFRDIHESCEPAMFSLEQLLFALGHDQRVLSDALEQMLPMLHEVCDKESAAREQLKAAGVLSTEMVHNEKSGKGKKQLPPFKSVENECDLCRANLYISMVRTDEGNVYCLQHALKNLNNGNIQAKQCKLIHAYNVDDIDNLIKALNERIQLKRNAIVNKKAK